MNKGINDYIENRAKKQIECYKNKATKYKKYTDRFYIVTMLISFFITVLPNFTTLFSWINYLLPVLGAVIFCITSWTSHKRYSDAWIEYRNAENKLKGELLKFQYNFEKYADAKNPENLFKETFEKMLSQEMEEWYEAAKSQKDDIAELQQNEV